MDCIEHEHKEQVQMSVKKKHLYNMAWWKACELYVGQGRPFTAGEFAKFMGIARSTAVRWIIEMCGEGGLKHGEREAKNRAVANVYVPLHLQGYIDQQRYLAEAERSS